MAYDRPVLRILLTYVLPLVLSIYCLVQAATTKDDEVRHLPKLAWILLIALFPWIGAVAWLIAGQPRRESAGGGIGAIFPALRNDPTDQQPSDQWWPVAPDEDADFQRQVRDRAEQQRQAYREKQRRETERGQSKGGQSGSTPRSEDDEAPKKPEGEG